MNKKKKLIIVGVVAIVLIIVIAVVNGGGDEQIILSADVAIDADISVVLKQTGIVKPQVGAMISVGSRVTGTLDMVGVKVGDTVTEGQLVAEIDSRSIRQSISQSKDNLDKATADYNRVVEVYPVEERMQRNSIEANQSNYEYLKGVYEREQVLYEKGYSRKETLDKTQHDMISAKTEYERSILQLELMQAEYKTNLVTLQADINRQRSVLEEQEIQLTYTEIYSPIDGIVSTVSSVQGETIVAGLNVANLITVFRPELLEMYIYVDESDIGKVSAGMPVEYTVDTYIGKTFAGVISRINLESVTLDGVIYYVAIVEITKDDAILLRPEMTTNVEIITESKHADVTVANGAIKWENGAQIVHKVINKAGNVTEVTPVKVGLRGETRTEILEGVAAGDELAVRFGMPGDAVAAGAQ